MIATMLLLVLSTFPDAVVAQSAAHTLVTERLAACVNIVPGVTSIYRWEGNVETAGEVLAIIKTTEAAHPALEARLRALHPYQVPEIVALHPQTVADSYLKWVAGETGGTTGESEAVKQSVK